MHLDWRNIDGFADPDETEIAVRQMGADTVTKGMSLYGKYSVVNSIQMISTNFLRHWPYTIHLGSNRGKQMKWTLH